MSANDDHPAVSPSDEVPSRDELADRYLDHLAYDPYPVQEEALLAWFSSEQGVLVCAPTGTGKTLAYLVPALATGRRVVVSTGTRNLQDQIYTKDIPFLRERAGLEISACVMKGRENYLCRYRLDEVAREPLLEDADEAPWVGRIVEWSRETQSGDRAEIADLIERLQ